MENSLQQHVNFIYFCMAILKCSLGVFFFFWTNGNICTFLPAWWNDHSLGLLSPELTSVVYWLPFFSCCFLDPLYLSFSIVLILYILCFLFFFYIDFDLFLLFFKTTNNAVIHTITHTHTHIRIHTSPRMTGSKLWSFKIDKIITSASRSNGRLPLTIVIIRINEALHRQTGVDLCGGSTALLTITISWFLPCVPNSATY